MATLGFWPVSPQAPLRPPVIAQNSNSPCSVPGHLGLAFPSFLSSSPSAGPADSTQKPGWSPRLMPSIHRVRVCPARPHSRCSALAALQSRVHVAGSRAPFLNTHRMRDVAPWDHLSSSAHFSLRREGARPRDQPPPAFLPPPPRGPPAFS